MAKQNDTPYYKHFQEKFFLCVVQARKRRIANKATQEETARLLGVSLRQIHLFEKGLAESAYILDGYAQLYPETDDSSNQQ